jgi:hypothetical protein
LFVQDRAYTQFRWSGPVLHFRNAHGILKVMHNRSANSKAIALIEIRFLQGDDA